MSLFIILLFFFSHLMNFPTAPWNSNGLFDDAAWDIYFAKNHIFNGTPFQPAFFDSVGVISREVVFHYYISIFFVLFGYNLLVFNVSLLVLGFITVFFTTFLIQRLFSNTAIAVLSAIVLNFSPFHFMHIFMGHRYAIVAPLMMVSLYYLYTAFKNTSFSRAIVSAVFAALCFGSAIMGKQYLYGLVLAALVWWVKNRGQKRLKEKKAIEAVWVVSFLIAAMPLLIYIGQNYAIYTLRENSLMKQFVFWPNLRQLGELFFAKHTYLRQFLPGFYLVPLAYYGLIIPGLFLAWRRGRFEIVFLALVPVVATLVAGSYDFRVLLAAPIWVVCMAFSLNFLLTRGRRRIRSLVSGLGLGIVGVGLLPSLNYIWVVSRNPNALYLLPHKDVAISRLVQDIVVGADKPTDEMKKDEFDRKIDMAMVPYDTLFCPLGAYAIAHVYLQNYDDKRILAFCDQGIQLLKTREEILSDNIKAIDNYPLADKDLKLIWEVSDKTTEIIKKFRVYRQYGFEEEFTGAVDGNRYALYALTIKNKFIGQFQKEIVWNTSVF